MADHMTETGDDDLLQELAALYDAVDPVPDDLADEVRIAITVQALQAEVAEIVAGEPVATRSETQAVTAETITFTASAISLMVSLQQDDDTHVTIDGWVTVGGATIEVHTADQVRHATADDEGRFVVPGVPRGRTWFVVRREAAEGAPPVVTPPIEL